MYKNKNSKPKSNNYYHEEREPKKDYRRKSSNGLPRNQKYRIPLNCYGVDTQGNTYEFESLLALLEKMDEKQVYNLISVPVYMQRSEFTGDPKMTSRVLVGFIKDFDIEALEADVTIYSGRTETFKSFPDPVLCVRVVIKNGKAQMIIGFDITDRSKVALN